MTDRKKAPRRPEMDAPPGWPDGVARCRWANPKNPAYIAYHDLEWGRPTHDDALLWEHLVLEIFQAGLSFECVLNRRPAFRALFPSPQAVIAMNGRDEERLVKNPAIIRNRRKIAAAIRNARPFLDVREEWGSFASYIWHFTGGRVIREQCRASSPLSDMVAGDLKKRGFSFIGTVNTYAFLQATGIIWGHEAACFLCKKDPL